jgi:hypothetical protein
LPFALFFGIIYRYNYGGAADAWSCGGAMVDHNSATKAPQKRYNRNMIDLNNITDFFKPNRQVWQDAEPAGGNIDVDTDADTDADADVDSDTDIDYETEPEPEEEISLEKLGKDLAMGKRAIEFKKQAKKMCDDTKSNLECSLIKIKESQEVVRLETFVDELYEAMEPDGKASNFFKRLDQLKESCDMERIIKCFERAEKYDILTYSDEEWEKDPSLTDKIIFTYEDGEMETINLELTGEEKGNAFSPVSQGLQKITSKADSDEVLAQWRKNHPLHDPYKEWRAEYEKPVGTVDPWKEWRAKYADAEGVADPFKEWRKKWERGSKKGDKKKDDKKK